MPEHVACVNTREFTARGRVTVAVHLRLMSGIA
jgi:hypothetical protein